MTQLIFLSRTNSIAACVDTIYASAYGTQSSTVTSTTATGAAVPTADELLVTAGAEKLAAVTGTCTAAPSSGAAASSAAAPKMALGGLVAFMVFGKN